MQVTLAPTGKMTFPDSKRLRNYRPYSRVKCLVHLQSTPAISLTVSGFPTLTYLQIPTSVSKAMHLA